MNNRYVQVSLFALLMLTATAGAAYVNVSQPYSATIYNNGSILLGKVGPGQTFFVTISSTTASGSGQVYQYGWNRMIAGGLPPGWIAENSSLNYANLSVKVTPPPAAVYGIYSFNLTAINTGNYSGRGAVRFRALINVPPNVFQLNVTPTNISAGPGQPSTIKVTINNTGVSDSPFLIKVQGLPGWNASQSVIARHHTISTYDYPVYQNTPGVYHAALNVTSSASPLITKRSNVTIVISASLLNDYRAIGQGAIGFPIILEPVYALMHLISKLFG